MRKFNFHFLVPFLALTLSPTYTTHAVTSCTLTTHKIDHTTIAVAWILIHRNGRRRSPVSRDGGERGGRQAPAVVGRGLSPPGSPHRELYFRQAQYTFLYRQPTRYISTGKPEYTYTIRHRGLGPRKKKSKLS